MKAVIYFNSRTARRHRAAFSLLEMLVGMGILSILVLALFAMFNQTQKALLANVGQSDVMENGRAVSDLLVRDLVRARPANLGTNYVYEPGTNRIVAVVPPAANLVVVRTAAGVTNATVRAAFSDGWRRDTLLHDLFYLAEIRPDQWTGAGLFVSAEDPENPDDGVGTLYRYEDRQLTSLKGARGGDRAEILYRRFFGDKDFNYRLNPTNSNRLLDGVVFFRVTPFGRSGEALDRTILQQTNIFPIPTDVLIGPASRYPLNVTLFRGRAFPSSLEIELGVLPTGLLDRYRSLPANPAGIRARFLTNNIANVLVFRQRIPMATSPVLP